MTASHDRAFAEVRIGTFDPHTVFRAPAVSSGVVNVTTHGYRSNGVVASWPPAPDSVFVFGGSTAFGYGLPDHETIPARLDARMQGAVYNFASPNFSSTRERIRFEQLLVEGNVPGTAIFIDGFSDFIAPYYEPLMFARFQPRRGVVGRFMSSAAPGRVPDPAEIVDRYVANVRLTRAGGKEFGVRTVFVWQPVPCYGYAGPAESHGDSAPLIECVREGYDIMARRHTEIADLLWLADMQRGRTEPLYIDADHYNAAFSEDIAAAIARSLA